MKKLLFCVIVSVVTISFVIVFSSVGCKSSAPSVEKPIVEEVTDELEEEIIEEVEPLGKNNEEETKEQTDTVKANSEMQYFIGAWINTEYDGQGRSGMVVYRQETDGTITYSAYDNSDGSGNEYKGSVRFLSEWTDDEGRIYTQSNVTLEDGMAWDTLSRISVDGKTLEVQQEATEIDINDSVYSIYYLQ